MLLTFIAKRVYLLLFGWHDLKTANRRQMQLQREIEETLPFLFRQYGAQVVPNWGVRFPPPFDYGMVTLAVQDMLIRFIRGRGELDVRVAPTQEASKWHDLSVIIAAIQTPDDVRYGTVSSLRDAARLLEAAMPRMQQVFSGADLGKLRDVLDKFDSYEQAAAKQLQNEINRRLYD